VFVMQDELTRAIVSELTTRVIGTASTPVVRAATAVPEAYALYLQGCYFLNKRTAEGFVAGIEHFRRATERDPDYAAAYAHLAYCFAMAGFDTFGAMSPQEAMPKAQAAASKALKLDPTLPEAHGAQAVITALFHWDWAAAEREFDRTLSLGGKSAPTHLWHALFLCAMCRYEEALGVVTTALAFDPLSLGLHLTLGRCLVFARRYEAALAKLHATLEMEPTHPPTYWELGRVYQLMGMHSESAALLERGMQLSGRVPILLMYAGSAYANMGQRERALGICDELHRLASQRYLSPIYESHVLGSLGDHEGGFRLIERAYELRSGWLIFTRSDPIWEPLHDDPRYLALLKKLKLDF
jgi:tetratricopeptide (TPR) repeat protein